VAGLDFVAAGLAARDAGFAAPGAGFAAAVAPRSACSAASAAACAGRVVAPARRFGAVPDPGAARFALRFPGRDRGRFSSTPPSSVIAGSLG
jgi:hypothetical protein